MKSIKEIFKALPGNILSELKAELRFLVEK
jgi:hypothetical protein